MIIDIVTLFPKLFESPFSDSVISRARTNNLVEINIHDLRRWAVDKRGSVDDTPYGGGAGMVLRIEPFYEAVQELTKGRGGARIILLSPQGEILNQKKAASLSKKKHLILLCGHYEGVDERVRILLADEEISIGDYVLSGGELPAMVLTDCLVRLIPGVLENEASAKEESFNPFLRSANHPVLEYPQYTKPREFKGLKVPEVLLSGDHEKIRRWREEEALKRTRRRRPDLLKHQAT